VETTLGHNSTVPSHIVLGATGNRMQRKRTRRHFRSMQSLNHLRLPPCQRPDTLFAGCINSPYPAETAGAILAPVLGG
jgi:ribosomal protein L39E